MASSRTAKGYRARKCGLQRRRLGGRNPPDPTPQRAPDTLPYEESIATTFAQSHVASPHRDLQMTLRTKRFPVRQCRKKSADPARSRSATGLANAAASYQELPNSAVPGVRSSWNDRPPEHCKEGIHSAFGTRWRCRICTENREYSEPRISMINGLGCVSNCGSPAAKKHCSDAALNSHQGLGSDSCLHPGSVERSPSD